MNNIIELHAKLAAKDAEIASLRDSLRDLRSLADAKSQVNPMDNGLAGLMPTKQVMSYCEQAQGNADNAYARALYVETGPEIASGGCAWRGRLTCSHEPSLRPNGWHCPLCAELLPGDWNDTDARARERMRKHWVDAHRRTEIESCNPSESSVRVTNSESR